MGSDSFATLSVPPRLRVRGCFREHGTGRWNERKVGGVEWADRMSPTPTVRHPSLESDSMTSRRILALAGLMLTGSMISTLPALAQQGAPPPAADRRGPPPDGRRGPPTVDARVQRMTADLGLSAEQATRVRTLLTAERREADSLLADRARRQDAERAAMMTMRTGTEKSLSAILTSDQRLKHDAMRARGGEGRGGRDGRGPGRGGNGRRHGGDRNRR